MPGWAMLSRGCCRDVTLMASAIHAVRVEESERFGKHIVATRVAAPGEVVLECHYGRDALKFEPSMHTVQVRSPLALCCIPARLNAPCARRSVRDITALYRTKWSIPPTRATRRARSRWTRRHASCASWPSAGLNPATLCRLTTVQLSGTSCAPSPAAAGRRSASGRCEDSGTS